MFKSIRINLFFVFSMMSVSIVSAQTTAIFKTQEEYLDYIEKNFDISSDEIYYVFEDNRDSKLKEKNALEEFSIVMFFKGNKYTTIEKVTEDSQCPPKKLIKLLSVEEVEKNLTEINFDLKELQFKNMKTGDIFIPKENEIVIVYLFTHTLGKHATMYIKRKEDIAKKCNAKNIILTIDDEFIEDKN